MRTVRDVLLGRRGLLAAVLAWLVVAVALAMTPLFGVQFILLAVVGVPALGVAVIRIVRPSRWLLLIMMTATVMTVGGFGLAWWGFGEAFEASENNTSAPVLATYWPWGALVFLVGTGGLIASIIAAAIVKDQHAAGRPASPADPTPSRS